jgi:hypothetical protein
MTDYEGLLDLLNRHDVKFILIGGAAGIAHGSPRLTLDVDVVYHRTNENIVKIVDALANHAPYLRGAPPGLPFLFDAQTIKNGLNFTLETDLGWLDLLGEVTGGGSYEDLLSHTIVLPIFSSSCLCLDLPTLIATKRAAGRPKDLDAIAELEALREESDS